MFSFRDKFSSMLLQWESLMEYLNVSVQGYV